MVGRLGKWLLNNIICKRTLYRLNTGGGGPDLRVCSILFNLIQLPNFLFDLILGCEQSKALIRHTVQSFTESDDTRCCDNTICPPEDEHVDARNMSRIVM